MVERASKGIGYDQTSTLIPRCSSCCLLGQNGKWIGSCTKSEKICMHKKLMADAAVCLLMGKWVLLVVAAPPPVVLSNAVGWRNADRIQRIVQCVVRAEDGIRFNIFCWWEWILTCWQAGGNIRWNISCATQNLILFKSEKLKFSKLQRSGWRHAFQWTHFRMYCADRIRTGVNYFWSVLFKFIFHSEWLMRS